MRASKFWILGLGLLLIVATTAQAQQVTVLNEPHNVAQYGTATSPNLPQASYDPMWTIDDRISHGVPGYRDFWDRVHYFDARDETAPYQIDVDLNNPAGYNLTELQAYVLHGDDGSPGDTFVDADRIVSQVQFFVDQISNPGVWTSVGIVATAESDYPGGFDKTVLNTGGPWNGVTDVRYEFTLDATANQRYPPRIAEVLAIDPSVPVTYQQYGGQENGLVLSGGGLTLIEEGGTFDANNLATATGAVAFGTPGHSAHPIPNANDGVYGNSNAWLAYHHAPYAEPFIGIDLNGSHTIRSVAFGRENTTAGNPYADRWASTYFYETGFEDVYTLQYTTVADPDVDTPDEQWITIGTLDYIKPGGENWTESGRRHRFTFNAVTATGLRLIVPYSWTDSSGKAVAIDELEVYAIPEPGTAVLLLGALAALLVLRRRDS